MALPSQDATEPVYTSHWRQDGGIVARCRDCPFEKRSKGSPQTAVKRHVEQTGHKVDVFRRQWKIVMPESELS